MVPFCIQFFNLYFKVNPGIYRSVEGSEKIKAKQMFSFDEQYLGTVF
jgi:hypothetical protein